MTYADLPSAMLRDDNKSKGDDAPGQNQAPDEIMAQNEFNPVSQDASVVRLSEKLSGG
jgi:hypothetical protein